MAPQINLVLGLCMLRGGFYGSGQGTGLELPGIYVTTGLHGLGFRFRV